MVKAQGGTDEVILTITKLEAAPFRRDIVAETSGYIIPANAELVGILLGTGAGREKKGDPIDPAAIILLSKTGDYVEKGDAGRTSDRRRRAVLMRASASEALSGERSRAGRCSCTRLRDGVERRVSAKSRERGGASERR